MSSVVPSPTALEASEPPQPLPDPNDPWKIVARQDRLLGELWFGRGVTGVTESLTARHEDPIMGEGLHAHTWSVTAFYPAQPLRDGRALKAGLRNLLDHLPDPLPWWSGEEIAQHVAQLLANCIGCRVTRPEGFEAWIWL